MQRLINPVLILLITALSGCASMTHSPVKDFSNPGGIPYYLGSYYLLVHTDGKGNLESTILYLPDRSKKMVAKPTAFLCCSSNSVQLTESYSASDCAPLENCLAARQRKPSQLN